MRRPTAKRYATTSTSRMSRRGSMPARSPVLFCTKSPWCSRTSRCHSGATNDGSRLSAPGSRPAMNLTLHVWRQASATVKGAFVRYEATDVSPDMSFLEMLDVVNEGLTARDEIPIAFDHDCREGICGMCGFMINGIAHGPSRGTATCQLHLRLFKDRDELWIEPWRSRACPVVKDLVLNRGAFDRIMAAGGYISVSTGSAPEPRTIPVPSANAEQSMDAD